MNTLLTECILMEGAPFIVATSLGFVEPPLAAYLLETEMLLKKADLMELAVEEEIRLLINREVIPILQTAINRIKANTMRRRMRQRSPRSLARNGRAYVAIVPAATAAAAAAAPSTNSNSTIEEELYG
jgi:hypothetical protein